MNANILWATELQQVQKMSVEDEESCLAVAQEIEYLLQYEFGIWPECKVEVFGSSQSLYGSPTSDIDMCVLTTGPCTKNKLPTELLDFYYLKRLMERKVWDDDHVRMTTAERIAQLKKTSSQVLQGVIRLFNSRVPKQRDNADFFDNEMQLLVDALDAELDTLYWEARSRRGAVTTPQTAMQDKMLRASKRRKNELFNLKPILEAEPEFEIQALASHARVPVIRFRYMQGGLDYKCDLCFDNELGVRNTRLLRAYASFDDRVRELGLAVKYWAKQRSITDTASGFLSSYSYVLLSIYYLQVAHVLPNLQDPRLLELAAVSSEYYDGVSIAFCEDRDIASVFYEQTTAESDSEDVLDKSLPDLLLGFFEFYATQFDYGNHVVAIRSPERTILKTDQWGNQSKTWRMSIQDPLQTSRDVGGVLHFSGQRKITRELRRAREKLEQGESFLDSVCVSQ